MTQITFLGFNAQWIKHILEFSEVGTVYVSHYSENGFFFLKLGRKKKKPKVRETLSVAHRLNNTF